MIRADDMAAIKEIANEPHPPRRLRHVSSSAPDAPHRCRAIERPSDRCPASDFPRSRSHAEAREQSERDVIVKSFDGRVENFELKNPNWDFAMDYARRAAGQGRAIRWSRQWWYRAIGAYFAIERRFAEALSHFDHARAVVPDDPRVLFGEACLNRNVRCATHSELRFA
jgi:hypothetical protein